MPEQLFPLSLYELVVLIVMACIYGLCIRLHYKAHPHADIAGPLGTYIILAGLAVAFYFLSAGVDGSFRAELFFALIFFVYSAWFIIPALQEIHRTMR